MPQHTAEWFAAHVGKIIRTDIAALFLATGTAHAVDVCVVVDPTGTPLNVRNQPNGKILFTLRNGTGVRAENLSDDQKWIEVFPLAGHNKDRKGWAYLDFLDCGEA
jgi:hypothetical protein